MASRPFLPWATTLTSSTPFSRKVSSSRANCSSSTMTADKDMPNSRGCSTTKYRGEKDKSASWRDWDKIRAGGVENCNARPGPSKGGPGGHQPLMTSMLLRRRCWRLTWLNVALLSASLIGQGFLRVTATRRTVFIVGPFRSGGFRMFDGFHGNYLVATLLVIAIRNSHDHHVFVDLEFTFLAHGKNSGMLVE